MLSGAIVTLRAPTEADKVFLHTVRNDFEAQLMLMSLPRANTPDRVEAWISSVLDDSASVIFVIADKVSAEAAGFLQVRKMDFVHGTGEMGIYLDAKVRGKGYASEALQLLEQYLKDVFNLRKLMLMVLEANERAIRFYRKAGWQQVGIMTEHFYQKQRYHNVILMEKFLGR